MYEEITKCRICGNNDLVSILHLGSQALTGVFPKDRDQIITKGPIELVKCKEDKQGNYCGLVQLRHIYDMNELYGTNYGYRSGLNKSMVDQLHGKVEIILKNISLADGDIVLDIGSNDGTLLKAYPKKDITLVGIDPTGKKFSKYYPKNIMLIPSFFSSESFKNIFNKKKAKVITSIAMFYDLVDPLDFARQVHDILDDNGVWVFEQSYLPTMLKMNAYDTICHEHQEYYSLKQIKWLTDNTGFKIIDVEFNNTNGGSFSVMVAKTHSSYKENGPLVAKILQEEREQESLNISEYYDGFKQRVHRHRDNLCEFINKANADGRKVAGYGASTKGNVILQFCKLTSKDIPFIAEVNEDKYGCYTPGTGIPIVSESHAKMEKPDYFLVLPWHFRENIIEREIEYVKSGGNLLFPLPSIEIIGKLRSQ